MYPIPLCSNNSTLDSITTSFMKSADHDSRDIVKHSTDEWFNNQLDDLNTSTTSTTMSPIDRSITSSGNSSPTEKNVDEDVEDHTLEKVQNDLVCPIISRSLPQCIFNDIKCDISSTDVVDVEGAISSISTSQKENIRKDDKPSSCANYIPTTTTIPTQKNDKNIPSQHIRNDLNNQLILAFDDFLLCPIGLELFRDPVMIASGHTFERENIQSHFQSKLNKKESLTCPLTNTLLTSSNIWTNWDKRRQVENWIKSQKIKYGQDYIPNGWDSCNLLAAPKHIGAPEKRVRTSAEETRQFWLPVMALMLFGGFLHNIAVGLVMKYGQNSQFQKATDSVLADLLLEQGSTGKIITTNENIHNIVDDNSEIIEGAGKSSSFGFKDNVVDPIGLGDVISSSRSEKIIGERTLLSSTRSTNKREEIDELKTFPNLHLHLRNQLTSIKNMERDSFTSALQSLVEVGQIAPNLFKYHLSEFNVLPQIYSHQILQEILDIHLKDVGIICHPPSFDDVPIVDKDDDIPIVDKEFGTRISTCGKLPKPLLGQSFLAKTLSYEDEHLFALITSLIANSEAYAMDHLTPHISKVLHLLDRIEAAAIKSRRDQLQRAVLTVKRVLFSRTANIDVSP